MGRGSKKRITTMTVSAVAIFGAASASAQTVDTQFNKQYGTQLNTIGGVPSTAGPSASASPTTSSLGSSVGSSTASSTSASTTSLQFPGLANAPAVGPLPANVPYAGVLSFTTGAEYESNRQLVNNPIAPTFSLYEQLGFGLRAANSTDVFDLQSSIKLEYENLVGKGVSSLKFTEPNVVFSYSRDTGNSTIGLSGDYWQGDVSNAYSVDPTNPALITPDTGTLTRTDTVFDFQTGLNDPLGFFANVSYSTIGYSGTSNPSLIDSNTTDGTIGATFRFSKTTQGSVSVSRTDFDQQQALARDVITTNYAIGVSHELPRAMTLYGNFGYQDRERKNFLFSVTESGYYGGVDFTQDVSNGQYFGGLNFDNTGVQNKTLLSFGRNMTLPDGSLEGSLTLSFNGSTGIPGVQGASALEYYGYVNYIKQMQNGSLNFNVSRDLTVNQNYFDIIYSQLGVGYQQQINTASAFDVSLQYGRTEGEALALIPTQDLATFVATYSHTVAPDWFLNVGYERRQFISSANNSDANSDKVFVTLTKDIRFGF